MDGINQSSMIGTRRQSVGSANDVDTTRHRPPTVNKEEFVDLTQQTTC